MEINERIKNRRLELNLTLDDIAKKLGVAVSTVSRYESKDIQNMGIDKIQKLADALDTTPGYLMGWSSEEVVIPKIYSDKFKVTSRDKMQYAAEMKKANEAFFLDDDLSEDAKKEMLDLMAELFWEAKSLNKRTPKDS